MTLGDSIRDAVERRDAGKAGKIADFLRFRKGFNYNATRDLFTHCAPALDAAGFEALMHEADWLEGHS